MIRTLIDFKALCFSCRIPERKRYIPNPKLTASNTKTPKILTLGRNPQYRKPRNLRKLLTEACKPEILDATSRQPQTPKP